MTTTKWSLDPVHSELGFKIKHLMITNVSGTFGSFEGSVETDGEDFTTAQIRVDVKMDSINTNNPQRDEHLRNSDFFEVNKYPELKFESTRIEKEDDDTFFLFGNLTMKGISKPVKLKVEYAGLTKDPWGGKRAGFVVTGKINRSDWGITFNAALETGGVVLSEQVNIHSELQLIREAVAVAV